jgi:hypothetical protein
VGKRRAGKSEAIDAVRAARELFARPRPGQVRADGDREALRLLMVDRDNAVASANTARTVLAGLSSSRWALVEGSGELAVWAPAKADSRCPPLAPRPASYDTVVAVSACNWGGKA